MDTRARSKTPAELFAAINQEHDDPPWETDPVAAVQDETPNRIANLEAALQVAQLGVYAMGMQIKQLRDERDYVATALREACVPAAVVAAPVPTPHVMPARAMRAPRLHGWQSMR